MNKILVSLFSVLCLISTPVMAKTVVGKVNIQKILLTVKEGQKVREKLKKEFDKKQAKLKKEEEKVRKAQADFQKGAALFSDSKKAKMQQDIQKQIFNLQQQTVKYQKEIQGMEQKLKEPILKKLRDVINTVSKSAGVDMTFEVSTAPIVYAKDSKDLTDEVIKAYNKKHK